MTMKKKCKRTSEKMIWERGSRGHTLWLGKQCVGRITLEDHDEVTVYRCTTGTLVGETTNLRDAKKWVKDHAEFGLVQKSLF